jgi:hypothetical protein
VPELTQAGDRCFPGADDAVDLGPPGVRGEQNAQKFGHPLPKRKTSMAHDPQKRALRQLKRVLKRSGSKHRRRDLKKQLAENPEEAADAVENLGRSRSDTLNGLDRVTPRPRNDEEE